jgi:predicted ArsR family transcriptional regulator
MEVNLASITRRNLQDVAAEVKKIISTALEYAAPRHGELDFLPTISSKMFDRAIAAYDLHMREGLTLTEIAKRKRWSPDQVEKDVKRIYRAIHRKGYTARRRRIDTPAEGFELYHCDKHAPKECPEGCEYMNDWLTKFNRTSPTDTTGSGRRSR